MSATAVSDASEDAEPAERLRLSVVEEAGDWGSLGTFADMVDDTARALDDHPACAKARGCEASVVLADDALLRALNRAHRGRDNPTNVLSFPFQAAPGKGGGNYLGDVVIAAETLGREAKGQGIPLDHHFRHLVVHGVLHLLGFDHETDTDADVMERIEIEVLAGLGISDPYSNV